MDTLCCRHRLLLPKILLLMVLISPLTTEEADREPRFFSHPDIMADFREGWETAGQFVGLDTSQGVASLVSSSFSPSTAEDKQYPPSAPSTSLFHGFFRLLGFDTSKLNAIAVNAVVFIAKMIGSSLIKNFTGSGTGRDKGENDLEGSPLSWILEDVKTQVCSATKLLSVGMNIGPLYHSGRLDYSTDRWPNDPPGRNVICTEGRWPNDPFYKHIEVRLLHWFVGPTTLFVSFL
ncbi:hypothetical protein J6590_007124 [Homalodisca vitripennis]|nr:hypothetical protein J6590_007124 [Homalodisca vitripennis]